MSENNCDVIIVGGGVIGSAVAYYLMRLAPELSVVVFEKDASYTYSSSARSEGNIRLQFSLKENVQISLYGLEVLKTFEQDMATEHHTPHISFKQQGNMFMVKDDAEVEASARRSLAMQQTLGATVEWLTPHQVRARVPIYNLHDCAGATFGAYDGTMSPMDVLMGYRKKALALGARFIEMPVAEVLGAREVDGVRLATGEEWRAEVVVNAAGAKAAELAKSVQISLPVVPIKRQVFFVDTTLDLPNILPALFFPSGLYVIHEARGSFVCGRSCADDVHSDHDFSWDKRRFEEVLWPELVSYLPKFEGLKLRRGWAGMYAVNTFDHNAILGEWPELKGFYVANGFSGHGFQQCHAVGRYLAELILKLEPQLNLSIFSPQRLLDNTPLFESPDKII